MKEVKKELTDKEKKIIEVNKVLQEIKKLEKDFSQELIKSACSKYSLAILERRNAEKDIRIAEKKLEEAKRRLNQ